MSSMRRKTHNHQLSIISVIVLLFSTTKNARSLNLMLLTRAAVPFIRPVVHSLRNEAALPRSGGNNRRIVTQFSSMSSGDDEPTTDDTGNEPTTGWLHKKPKKWTANDEVTSSKPGATNETPMATGWLHKKPSPRTTSSADAAESSSTTTTSNTNPPQRQQQQHLITSPPHFLPCNSQRLAVITRHTIPVPLDHSSPSSSNTITISFSVVELITSPAAKSFFTSLTSLSPAQRATEYVTRSRLKNMDRAILYLQGGPGFPSPAAGLDISVSAGAGSWIGEALGGAGAGGFERVVLLDQRGTGASTRLTRQSLRLQFPGFDEEEEEDEELAGRVCEYVKCFRADSIVRDAELVKEALMVPLLEEDGGVGRTAGPRPWGAVLGQSFGGFCILSYLSLIPHPPRICLLTGGIPPLLEEPVSLYESLFRKVRDRNDSYYEMFPEDVGLVKRIVRALDREEVKLPSGGILTPRRFLQLGLGLGGSPSAFLSLHALFQEAFVEDDSDVFSKSFLKSVDSRQPFDDNPIYYLLHESIYGDSSRVTWAAEEAYRNVKADCANWDYKAVLENSYDDSDNPIYFTGEHVFPWMSDGDYAELSSPGMKRLARALAETTWTKLYDCDRVKAVLSKNGDCEMAAAVYVDDMYVDFDACRKVTARGSPLERAKVWITNEYQHSGLRDDGARIFGRLLEMVRGSVRIPS